MTAREAAPTRRDDTPAVAITDSVKLTAYFGERSRVGGTDHRLAATALLDSFDAHGVTTSILLRGIEGFGRRQHVRSDSSLTLSEDLPLVAIAIDAVDRIEPVLADARRIVSSGLITVERARFGQGDGVGAAVLPADLRDAAKLTIYLGRKERVYRVPAFVAVCDLLHRRGVAGATVLLGVDGTTSGARTRARFFGSNADVPVMVVAVGAGDRIAQVLPELGVLLRHPVITLERVQVCKRDGALYSRPNVGGAGTTRAVGLQKLTVYASESTLVRGQAMHRALTRGLRRAGAGGSTTLRGVWGFHGDHRPHGDHVLQFGRRVPVVSILVDEPDRIAAAFDLVDELTAEHGLVTCEFIPRAGR